LPFFCARLWASCIASWLFTVNLSNLMFRSSYYASGSHPSHADIAPAIIFGNHARLH
jgi:hypothetical protein